MAKKIDSPKDAARRIAEDLAILYPERTATIAGRAVTMREYGFAESFGVYVLAEPLLADLTDAVALREGVAWTTVIGALAKHGDVVMQLVAKAADVDLDWVQGLRDADGQALLMLWWGVNGPFFVRRVVTALAIAAAAKRASAGRTSTPASSPTDTTPAPSDATPPAS